MSIMKAPKSSFPDLFLAVAKADPEGAARAMRHRNHPREWPPYYRPESHEEREARCARVRAAVAAALAS